MEPTTPTGGGLSAVAEFVAGFGAANRAVRAAIGLLTERPQHLDDLIRTTGLSRRAVEQLLDLMAPDLAPGGRAYVAGHRISAYREAFGYAHLVATEPPDPYAGRLDSSLLQTLTMLTAEAPTARQALDHVAATAMTLARRGLWLDATYDLARASLLFVGDHDLTSLAACAVNPHTTAAVVDLDERVLEYVDQQARRLGFRIRCYFGDLRFGLPRELNGYADVAFTDPPYTPEGVQLFLARAVQGLRDPATGRLVMAYGFSDQHPALGLKVQNAIQDLRLVYEAILPGFNRYHGAQAIGSTSDLYVCRPTARTAQVLDRALNSAAVNIYTHGSHSTEHAPESTSTDIARAVHDVAAGPHKIPVAAWVGDSAEYAHASRAQVLTRGLPPNLIPTEPYAVAADLAADPGPWLFRALLALTAARVALLVPNNHPDIANQSAQRALADAVRPKYRLVFRRSHPDSRHAIVEAVAVDPGTLTPRDRIARAILDRPFSKVVNAGAEALVKHSRATGEPLTRTAARALLASPELEGPLIDLPRHRIADILNVQVPRWRVDS
jgi:N4-bis(aminopropyl)spermidine synthase